MATNMSFLAAVVLLSACGVDQAATSKLAHRPTPGLTSCASDVDMPGDPHEMVRGTKIVFSKNLGSATISDYAVRAMYISTAAELYQDAHHVRTEEFKLVKTGVSSTLKLLKDGREVGLVEPLQRSEPQIMLTLANEAQILSCRR